MSIKVHDPINHNGLFDVLGTAFYSIATMNTARGATVPIATLAFLSQFALVAPTTGNADNVAGVGDATAQWQSNGASLTSSIQTACLNILNSFVQADTTTVVNGSLPGNMAYLVNQMVSGATTGGDHVPANTPTSTGTAVPGSNAGDASVVVDTTQGNGTTGQNVLAETIAFSVNSSASTTTPSIVANTAAVDSDRADYAWPAGSGLRNSGISLTDPASSLLTNGQFETDSIANLPDSWIPTIGVPGTSLLITSPFTATLTVSGSPTGGSYVVTWADQASIVHATVPIAYNAAAAAVQSALNAIPQLSGVTVTTTGTGPNYTHTVKFTGIGGSVATFSIINMLTGGSTPAVTPAAPSGGDTKSYSGQSLIFAANSAETTTLYQVLPTLRTNAVYFLHFRLLAHGMTSGGSNAGITVSIVSGIGGSAVVDAQGNSGNVPVKVSGTSCIAADAWGAYYFTFRLAPGTAQPAYLKVITSGLPAGGSVYFDDFALTSGQQLYAGGPFVAAFKGRAASAITDSWSYAIGNTWSTGSGTPPTPGGGFQTWFNRVFGMADMGLLLPTTGSTLAPAWVTSTAYIVGQLVTHGGSTYACLISHTSGTFATDLASGDWALSVIADALIT